MLGFSFFAKGLLEIGMLFLFGQGLLWFLLLLLSFGKPQENIVYALLQVITKPLFAIARFIMPKGLEEKQYGIVAFGVLFSLWTTLVLLILPELCLSAGFSSASACVAQYR